MGRNFLNKVYFLLVSLLLILPFSVAADTSLSSLFIKVTDATTALKNGDQAEAKKLVKEIEQDFAGIDQHDSKAGKEVSKSLAVDGDLKEEDLVKISKKLLAFEEEQNPVDQDAEKKKLLTSIQPKMDKLKAAIAAKDIESVKSSYKSLNASWTSNEAIVRSTSQGHYGKIETAISLLRSSMETEPVDYDSISLAYDDFESALTSFMKGEKVANKASNLTLADGIKLLEDAKAAFDSGDKKTAASKMKEFITIWPSIEGDVSTRNPSLYNRVESQSPIIMVKGEQKGDLTALIKELKEVNQASSYNFLDAAMILLREGLEALFIVMALVATLKAAKMKKGLVWVYGGAVLGLALSFVIAYVLANFFPSLTGASNREMIEGVVGLVAVAMMVLVGIWLHSKSNVKAWNDFLEKQMNTVAASGSFLSMFFLSFLAVFREGAETILFYAGILPKIDLSQFLLGIGLAVVVLLIAAFAMNGLTGILKPYKLFYWLTWMIYLLSFKMLGVSIQALQLTNYLPQHQISFLPVIESIGFYPNWESLGAQVFLVVLLLFLRYRSGEDHD